MLTQRRGQGQDFFQQGRQRVNRDAGIAAPWKTFTNSIGMTFNLIPAGTFTMGSPDGSGDEPAEPGRFSNETQHQVTLTKPFYM